MTSPARSRRPRLLAAGAICVAVAAVAVPALQGGAPSASESPRAEQQATQTLSAKPTPAPANAEAPVSTTPRTPPKPAGTAAQRAAERTAQTKAQTTARSKAGTNDATPHPKVLAHAERGTAAIKALGSKLPTVAARVGWSPTKLRTVLSTDHTAYVSDVGHVYFREDDLTAQASSDPQTSQTTNVAPIYPTSTTFSLHSHPSSTRKIFLDFDGATVAGTGWNGTGAGKTPDGSHTGFDLDGNPGSFSTAEDGYIQEVWREVAEDYAPFDVDVTTQDPGVDGITRSSTSDTSYGTHVVITSDPTPRTNLCSGSCLGVAYVGTFDNVDPNGYYQPAWVFDYSTSFDPMIIAQAAAHETGHTLGLSHDGTSTAPYSFGTAAWGPIMGGSMNRAVTQWSQGEYADANNQQDDLQIIQNTGLPLRPDDYTGTTDLGSHSSYALNGVIGTRTDTDDFSVTLACNTTLTVDAQGIGKQTTLDLGLTVLNSNGQTVASSSPASTYSGSPPVSAGMNASVSIPNASGTYVLRVDGVGNGDPANNGWSDYGSLGQYSLSSTGCSSAPAPAPAPASVALPSSSTSPTPSSPPAASSKPTTQPAPQTHRAPRAPRIGWATSGPRRGAKTATVRWGAPSDTGGTAVTSYRIQALRINSRGRAVHSYLTRAFRPSTRTVVVRLPAGAYRFRVQARNAQGDSPWSAYSRTVKAL